MDGLKKLAVAAIAVLAVPPLFSQPGVVGTDSGKLQGVTQGSVESFKGVPFAAPPVGELRWRAPQPVQPWSDVRQANAYSADCMQVPFPSDAAPRHQTGRRLPLSQRVASRRHQGGREASGHVLDLRWGLRQWRQLARGV